MAYISIIIPTFNRAQLLERCLKSLVASAIPELEIVVVDDGGADNSQDVAMAFPGVRYLRQDNAGPATARNYGFRSSTGRYVGFIDSDDEWINGGGQRLAAQLDAHPELPLVFADTSMGNDTSGFVSFIETYGGTAFEALPDGRPAAGLRFLDRWPFFTQLSTRNVMFLGSMLFRRDAFASLDGFDPKLCGAADWDLFMRAAATVPIVFSEGPPVSRYYKHDSAMSTDSDHMTQDFINALVSVRHRCQLPAAAGAHIDQRIRHHVFGWAYAAYDCHDFAVARRRLMLARRLGVIGARELLYLGLTFLPAPAVGALRRTRRALGL